MRGSITAIDPASQQAPAHAKRAEYAVMAPANPPDPEDDSARYKRVRGLLRGLDVLRAVNAAAPRDSSVAEISLATDLHRTTVQRLLETLLGAGYVRRGNAPGSYRVGLRALQLADGFSDADWISTFSARVMGEMLQKVTWPSSLTTLDGDAMLIRETTHRISPIVFRRMAVGQRVPVLLTAAGRACFAMLPRTERQALIARLKAGRDAQAAMARDPRIVNAIVERVREAGYATNSGDWEPQNKTGAVAMAIRHRGRPVASLNIVYLRTAVKEAEAVSKFVPALRESVARIVAMLKEGK